jgi:uncharacterized protein (DUF433 family)
MTAPMVDAIDLSNYIEQRDGRPHIRGRRLPVMFIVKTQQAQHNNITQLADAFSITEEQVLAALLYYREHVMELEAQFADDSAESRAMADRYHNKPGQS